MIARRNMGMIVGSLFALTVFEAATYTLIFSHLNRHNRLMAALLPERTIAKRNRKNALDLVGHFAHFVGEFSQILFSFIANLTYKSAFNKMALFSYVNGNGLLLSLTAYSYSMKITARNLISSYLWCALHVLLVLFISITLLAVVKTDMTTLFENLDLYLLP